MTFPSPCKKKTCGCKIMPLKFVSTSLCALYKVNSDFSQLFKFRAFMKTEFLSEVSYDSFLVSCRAKLIAPLDNNEDVACIFVQKYQCRTKLYNWRLYLHRLRVLFLSFALFKILHQVRILQCFQAVSYFCIEWGDLVITGWFKNQWYVLLEHAPQKMPGFIWAVQRWCSGFMVLALNICWYYLFGCPVWNMVRMWEIEGPTDD